MNPAVSLVFDAPKKSMPPQHWVDLSYDQQITALSEVNLPAFRTKQINKQFFQRYQLNPLTMSDIPLAAREILTEKFFPTLLTPIRTLTVDDGSTTKILWKLHDDTLLESVIMRYRDRVTLCISSQAGCGMACPFCATGQAGLQRNLSKAEIVEQVREAAQLIHAESSGNRRLSNIVFMGMGEPLANYARVIGAIREITSLDRFGISARSVTLSTVGVVPAIYKLREENLAVTLAVSLHAPDDELRDTLVPINNRWKIAEVMHAMQDYAQHTGRRISIEYALIKEVNDQEFRGKLLGKLLSENLGPLAHVNVIPLNPTPGSQWDASPAKTMDKFVQAVRSQGISCTIRQTRGQEIAAACGQLAAQENTK